MAYMVSTTLAPSPDTKPDLCPLLNDFCTTSMAIGPIGAEAHIPTAKPLSISIHIAYKGSKNLINNTKIFVFFITYFYNYMIYIAYKSIDPDKDKPGLYGFAGMI